MQKTQTRTINGRAYTVSQLPGMRGLLMWNQLLAKVAPALLQAPGALAGVKNAANIKSVADLDLGAVKWPLLSGAVETVFRNLPPSEFEEMLREFLETCHVRLENGTTVPLMPVFDIEMQGRIFDVYKLLLFAFEVNYGNFSGAVAKLLSAAAQATAGATAENASTPT